MTERDPFGRDTDEDPLAAMGWSGAPTALTTDQVVVEAPPPQRVPAAAVPHHDHDLPHEPDLPDGSAPPAAPRIFRVPPLVRWLPRLLFVGAFIAVVFALAIPAIKDVADEIDDI